MGKRGIFIFILLAGLLRAACAEPALTMELPAATAAPASSTPAPATDTPEPTPLVQINVTWQLK